uniref:Putative reverse transcriptase domain-containing protein n=1 Tax=Tanacetum cinerariifolium TaxID=118510 RepID=A0A6L2JSW2_TANCI|nr:putative reverse transcriptase domain-containing protein [Tanacetum cinerariifolium]
MHDEFEMSMIGELNFYLGLQIKQMKDGIFFNQSKYIKEMLKKFGLEDSKPMKTPMSFDTKLTKDEECESDYSILGADIETIVYVDSDHAGDYMDRKSTSDTYLLDLLEELNGVHDTFHVSNLKKCLADPTLQVRLDEIRVDAKLNFVVDPVEILEQEFKKLKRSRIAIFKVRWNSKRGSEFTWKREDQMKLKIDVIYEIIEEDFDVLLDEGSKILYSIEGTPLDDIIIAKFDEFIAMNIE